MRRRTKRTRRAMMRLLDQEYLVPPHWRASRRHTIAGTKAKVPRGSICANFCASPDGTLDTCGGDLKKNDSTSMARPPIGRLM